MLTRINEVLEEVPRWATRVVGNISFFIISFLFFFRKTHRTGPIPGCADTAGSRHPRPNTVPCSGKVLGHAGETITSAGNRLANQVSHPPQISRVLCFSQVHMWKGRGGAVGSGSQTPLKPESSGETPPEHLLQPLTIRRPVLQT